MRTKQTRGSYPVNFTSDDCRCLQQIDRAVGTFFRANQLEGGETACHSVYPHKDFNGTGLKPVLTLTFAFREKSLRDHLGGEAVCFAQTHPDLSVERPQEGHAERPHRVTLHFTGENMSVCLKSARDFMGELAPIPVR